MIEPIADFEYRILHLVLFVAACVSVHKWRQEPERVLKTLEKIGGQVVDGATVYPTELVKMIPLRGERSLVYYVRDGAHVEGAPRYAEREGGIELKTLGMNDGWEVDKGYQGAV